MVLRVCRRNILDDINNADSTVLPPPSEKESLAVYLRVKPNTAAELDLVKEIHGSDDSGAVEKTVEVESDYQVMIIVMMMILVGMIIVMMMILVGMIIAMIMMLTIRSPCTRPRRVSRTRTL